LNYDEFLSDYDGYDFDDFDDEDWKRIKIQYGFARDVKKMTKKFIKVINEFIPLEKVDDIDKLHKAFENDLKNGNFECEITTGCTD
jgi:hypothetical protein